VTRSLPLFGRESGDARGPLVRVIVEAAIARSAGEDGTLTYRAGSPPPRVGQRVRVPLGNRLVFGIVAKVGGEELAAGIDSGRLRVVEQTLDQALTPPGLALAKWISDYYHAPMGVTIAAMTPAPVKGRAGTARVVFASPVPERGGEAPAKLSPAARRARSRLLAIDPARFPMPVKELAAELGYKSAAPLKRLAAAGFLELREEEIVRSAPLPGFDLFAAPAPAPEPTRAQRSVVDGVGATLGSFHVHALLGVTGSGKTEVYLRLIERCLRAGRGAIVLVPEISLTPQTCARFVARFGAGRVALLHSGMTPAQRHAQWRRCESGAAPVVVGPRSAVFAPTPSLGLIVVDEEHDGSYKQDNAPRYHARDTAIKRAQIEGAAVLLASATLSLETWANTHAADDRPARFSLWRLEERAGGAALPAVEVVDLKEEARVRREEDPDGARRQHLLGPRLERAMDGTLARGGQVLLLLNRRGFAHYLGCPRGECGYVVQCESCDAPMVLHKDKAAPAGAIVRCHHCALELRVPRVCPSCGGPLRSLSAGTQRLEEEVERKFAALGVSHAAGTLLRMDSDSFKTAREYFGAVARVASGGVRVILGTQIVAKGHDFPGVRLVGIVDADTSLWIPDFRADERTFQLVCQAAGRAGRGTEPGRVVVQTYAPERRAIVCAARHDYAAFADGELAARTQLGLPPSRRMARVVCRDKDARRAEALGERVRAAIANVAGGASVSGVSPCAIGRIADRFRYEVRVLCGTATELRDTLARARTKTSALVDARAAIDVDPVNLL